MTNPVVTDQLSLRTVFAHIPTPIVALAAEIDGRLVGLTAGSFVGQSLNPPLVSVSIQDTSTTWPVLRQAESIGITVLTEDHLALVRQLAGPSAHRFDGVEVSRDGTAVLIDGAGVSLTTRLVDEIIIGDHIQAVFEVTGLQEVASAAPLIYQNRQVSIAQSIEN